MPMCIYSTGDNNGSERAGIHAERIALSKANTDDGNTLTEGNGYAVPSHALVTALHPPPWVGVQDAVTLSSLLLGEVRPLPLGEMGFELGFPAPVLCSQQPDLRPAPQCCAPLTSSITRELVRNAELQLLPQAGSESRIFTRCPGDVWA